MVKSKNTKNMTKEEIKAIWEQLESANKRELAKFRKEFNPDEMGFAEREEGI